MRIIAIIFVSRQSRNIIGAKCGPNHIFYCSDAEQIYSCMATNIIAEIDSLGHNS